MSQNFKQSYQEYDSYVTHNDPLSACAGDNVHEHRPIGSMLLLTQMNRTSFVIAIAQFHIHLSPTGVWENATHSTHLPIALDLH